MSNVIYWPGKESKARLGGKAGALSSLHKQGFLIPQWFCLTAEAFSESLTAEQRNLLARLSKTNELVADDLAALARALSSLTLNTDVQAQLNTALSVAGQSNELFAVRSSADDEDGQDNSFAGQLDSFLFVPLDKIALRIADVWRSAFLPRALAYRRERSLPPMPGAPAVLIQKMIVPRVSGVAFSIDPVTGNRDLSVVAAVPGLGQGLVAGEMDADCYRVNRRGQVLQSQIAFKDMSCQFDDSSGEGLKKTHTPPHLAAAPALSESEAAAVAELSRQAARHFGCPQDIEWAIAGGQLYLLQSRPVTACGERYADRVENTGANSSMLQIWDNSNISESYNGVTTPLTFSFAARAYEHVYRQFCRIMRVSEYRIAENRDIFPSMIALIKGRVYYNLRNWYRLLSLFPGYSLNRKFMEQMMGVKEGLPDGFLPARAKAGILSRLRDILSLLSTFAGLLSSYIRLERDIKRFYLRLDEALATDSCQLSSMSIEELLEHYGDLEHRLLAKWDAPLVNDFFAMIFYGLLRKLSTAWCNDEQGTLQNELISKEGGIVSAEPARAISAMAQLAARSPRLSQALCHKDLPGILTVMKDHPEFAALYKSYLQCFGDRCLEELKLESPTLTDDPLPMLRCVGELSLRYRSQTEKQNEHQANAGKESRIRAEKHVALALKGNPLKRLIFKLVVSGARARVRNRENLRFERTKIFARVRLLFLEIGRRLKSLGLLETERDIFYLEVAEILSLPRATATTANLKALVTIRKNAFDSYRRLVEPPERIETRGLPCLAQATAISRAKENSLIEDEKAGETALLAGTVLKGTGCCPGIVRGRARVITDPRNARIEAGEIIVARRTDPGWIMLFPAASGLLVEHGSLLSHSAIVARELGLPAIVSIPSVTSILKDGDLIELDGKEGTVRRLSAPETKPLDAGKAASPVCAA